MEEKQKKLMLNCLNKTAYNTEQLAEFYGSKYNLETYLCSICEKYHLTSKIKRKSRYKVR